MEVTLFTDKVGLKEFSKMDPEYRELLKRVLAIQADCEIGGPNLYVKHILPLKFAYLVHGGPNWAKNENSLKTLKSGFILCETSFLVNIKRRCLEISNQS